MRGLQRLRTARERLDDVTADPRRRLNDAAFEFLVATVERESWPIGLRIEAEKLRAEMLASGIADGGTSDVHDQVIREIAGQLRRFCARAEKAACRQREPHGRMSVLHE